MVKQDGAEEFDWRGFLLSLNIACSRITPNPRRARFLTEGRRYGKQVSLHPVVHYIKPEFINQEFGRDLAFLNRHNRDVNLAIPKRFIEQLQWFRRWTNSLEIRDFPRNDLLVCRTFQIRRGRIYLHMRQEMKWKTRRMPANIELISRLLNCALSPISHDDFQFLRCLQYGLLTSEDTALSQADAKGIEFLRSILNNDRVNLDRKKSIFLVEGVSGVTWSISPGNGPHGSRFRVRANSVNTGNMPGRLREGVCIVETPELRNLVLGDAIGTIILSLLDDITASREIETLEPAVRFALNGQRQGQDFLERLGRRAGREYELRNRNAEAEEIREMERRRADAEELAIRATVQFPRLWSVLLRLPLGTLTFTRQDEGGSLIQIQGYATTIHMRNGIEEELVNEMLISSGWIRMADLPNDPNHPHGVYVCHKTGTPNTKPSKCGTPIWRNFGTNDYNRSENEDCTGSSLGKLREKRPRCKSATTKHRSAVRLVPSCSG